MDIKKIDQHYFVSEQITTDDLSTIKESGVRAIVCNRPDNEAQNQPNHLEIKAMATELGMDFRYIPIKQGAIQDADLSHFEQAFDELPKPILAYCRSGNRSATIWSLTKGKALKR